MKPQNTLERKKLKFRFALVYIVSIVLLAVIFTMLWNMFGSPKQSIVNIARPIVPGELTILQQDQLFHTQLKHLHQLDENYANLLANSAGSYALDSINKVISKAEISFGDLIDSVGQQKKTLNLSSNEKELDSIIGGFKLALTNRKAIGYMREALSGENKNVSADKRTVLKLKIELDDKENKILALEDQVKNQKNPPADNSSAESQTKLQKEIIALQSDIVKEKAKASMLLNNNNSLTNENNSLTTQITELKTNNVSLEAQKKTEQGKNDNLMNKIEDLDTKLLFAKIDCNLSRVDAKQIIFSSKQRKDLLQESLNALNNLARSNNSAIQAKAKEKLSQVQVLANTTRD